MPALTIVATTRPHADHLAACEITIDGRSFIFATYEGTVRVGRHFETRELVALQPSLSVVARPTSGTARPAPPRSCGFARPPPRPASRPTSPAPSRPASATPTAAATR